MLRMAMMAMAGLLMAGWAQAQAPKLYKWTDAQGNVHYSDQVPPDQAGQAREKLNEQGVAVDRVDRALTPEEQAAKDAEDKRLAEEAKRAEEERRAAENLVNSYASEEDLTRAYQQRLDLLEQTVAARQVEIDAREKSLATLVAQAADLERQGKTVSDALKQMITSERAEIDKQKKFLAERENERSKAKSEYEANVARYRAAVAKMQSLQNGGAQPQQ